MKDNTDSAEEETITDGKYVLVQRGEQERIIEFRANQSIKYGRGSNLQEVFLEKASGCLFYTTFRVKLKIDNKRDTKTVGHQCFLEPIIVAETTLSIDRNSSGKDNRNIVDDNKSQPLGEYEIAKMRESGVSGPEILDTLVSNSKSFSQKTEYSQEKYLKKKEKQYGDTLIFLKPTLSILVDYYFRKDPARIMNMRADTLAQMLAFANVHANGKFIVYETGCSGLLVAAVLHRLGGHGIALHVHTGSTPQRQALFFMNFTTAEVQSLRSLDVFYIIRPTWAPCLDKSSSQETSNPESCEEPLSKKSKVDTSESISNNHKETDTSINPLKSDTKKSDEEDLVRLVEVVTSAVAKLGNINRVENERSLALMQTNDFDGLLIASKEHPLSILQCLLPRLGSSAPFAVFCQYSEPLVECYTWIKEKNLGVNLNIVENWLRNIQVETERTHPEINMNSNGGYLLFGISVKA